MGEFANLIWVAAGAALGGPARFFVSGVVGRSVGEAFPWGTLAVNVAGAFLLGALAGTMPAQHSPLWALAAVGFLGAFTTVSSLSLQTLALAREGGLSRAALNVGLSLAAGIAAVALGYALAGGGA